MKNKILILITVLALVFSSVSFAMEQEESDFEKVSSLSDDIAHFNKTILSTEKHFDFYGSGELFYSNKMALICRAEKIKIGRTENNQPVVEIGIWKENNPFETLEVNLCQEIMKYYAREDADGNKIFSYIDGLIGKNEKPDTSKVLKFGNTTIGLGHNEYTKEADMIIKLDSLMFGPKSIDDINKTVDGNITIIDISHMQVKHYQDREGRIRIDKVGSVDNSMMGTRSNGSSYEDDMAVFNKALKGTTWKITSGGHLQWASIPEEDPNSTFVAERNSNNKPVIKIRTWDRDGNVEGYMPCNEGMTMNMFMESAKYYSKSPKDGEALYWFVDRAFKDRREIGTGQIYQMGETKVKITDPMVFGLDIIFVD